MVKTTIVSFSNYILLNEDYDQLLYKALYHIPCALFLTHGDLLFHPIAECWRRRQHITGRIPFLMRRANMPDFWQLEIPLSALLQLFQSKNSNSASSYTATATATTTIASHTRTIAADHSKK
jgi:hypothetical protein